MIDLLKYFKVNTYPDGSSYVELKPVNDLKETLDTHATFFRIDSYNDLWILGQIDEVLAHKGYENLQIWIPNLFDAQADRRFEDNQSWGLSLVCDFLNNLKAFNYLEIFHPHNPDVVKSLMRNKVRIRNNTLFISDVLKRLDESNLALMAPDAGAYKPLMKLADILGWEGDVYSASKFRTYVDGESKINQHISKNNFGGNDILLIDDLCMRGGTLIGLAKMLRERNVGKLYCAFSHLTVSDPREELFEIYDKVFTTNSKDFDWKKLEEKYKNLEIYYLF